MMHHVLKEAAGMEITNLREPVCLTASTIEVWGYPNITVHLIILQASDSGQMWESRICCFSRQTLVLHFAIFLVASEFFQFGG